MGISTDQELNSRLIELSKAVSALFENAAATENVPTARDEALRAIAEQSEKARGKLSHGERP
ncbi:hypothetical protein [Arabiibacter massiliensis]|uniref:hypothetical protein n=1 Tax=Arabiibacter massiliensis TaxID=1870985 RepID=UPI0009BC62C7|nr:hypothetical protein [Arabiibacter massiliensis]